MFKRFTLKICRVKKTTFLFKLTHKIQSTFLLQNCSGFLCLQLGKTESNHWKKVILSRLKNGHIHRKCVILSLQIFSLNAKTEIQILNWPGYDAKVFSSVHLHCGYVWIGANIWLVVPITYFQEREKNGWKVARIMFLYIPLNRKLILK